MTERRIEKIYAICDEYGGAADRLSDLAAKSKRPWYILKYPKKEGDYYFSLKPFTKKDIQVEDGHANYMDYTYW